MPTRRPLTRALEDAARSGVPLVADGAMGTRLFEEGFSFDVCFELLSVTCPDAVSRVHESYVRAGAELVETNTFGANRVRLGRHGLEERTRELNLAAAALARAQGVYVGGAIGPTGLVVASLGSDARASIRRIYREQAEALLEGGVDALMLETFRDADELALALEGALEARRDETPIIAGMSVDAKLTLLGGAGVLEVGERARALGAFAVGVTCSEGPESVLAATRRMAPLGLPLLAKPSAGLPKRVGDALIYPCNKGDFFTFGERACALRVSLVGGCCGTRPEDIEAIARATHEAKARSRSPV